jgi:hypothetical protein
VKLSFIGFWAFSALPELYVLTGPISLLTPFGQSFFILPKIPIIGNHAISLSFLLFVGFEHFAFFSLLKLP